MWGIALAFICIFLKAAAAPEAAAALKVTRVPRKLRDNVRPGAKWVGF